MLIVPANCRGIAPLRCDEGVNEVSLSFRDCRDAELLLGLEFPPNSAQLKVCFANACATDSGCIEFQTTIVEGTFSVTLADGVSVSGCWRDGIFFGEVLTHVFSHVVCIYRVKSGELEGWGTRVAIRPHAAS